MSSHDLEALSPFLTETALASGELLHEPDHAVESVYFPSSAVLSMVTMMLDGRSVESATIGFESVAGLPSALSGSKSSSRVFAQVAGAAIRVPAARLREQAFNSRPLMQLLLRHVEATISQAQQSAACNALHETGPRLARWLLMTQDRVSGQILPLTQEYLAIMLGVQRTTVTLVASAFKRAGLIDYRRGSITILDREGLERESCECYALIKARFDNLHLEPHAD
jgi:CRP-like cAMP-binding protein